MPGLIVPGNNQLRGQSAFPMLHRWIGPYLDYPASQAWRRQNLCWSMPVRRIPVPGRVCRPAFDKMRRIWTANGAADKLETRVWPYGHVFLQDQPETPSSWLDKQSAGSEANSREKLYSPEAPFSITSARILASNLNAALAAFARRRKAADLHLQEYFRHAPLLQEVPNPAATTEAQYADLETERAQCPGDNPETIREVYRGTRLR